MAIGLQQLRYLAAVSEQGSLTAAAAYLGVSQPVLSRALAALQAELNATLLKRSGRKLVLTPDGEAALGPARRALAAVEDVKRSTLRRQTPPLLRIVTGQSLLPGVIDTLRGLLEAHPDMHVQVLVADTAEAISELLSTDQADLGFGERPAQRRGMRWRAWGQVELVLVSPPGLDLPPEIDRRRLAEVRLVSAAVSTVRQRTFDDLFLRSGVRPNVILEVAENSALMPLAQAGVGSFFAWRFCCDGVPGIEIRSFQPPYLVDIGFSYLDNANQHVRQFVEMAIHDQAIDA